MSKDVKDLLVLIRNEMEKMGRREQEEFSQLMIELAFRTVADTVGGLPREKHAC